MAGLLEQGMQQPPQQPPQEQPQQPPKEQPQQPPKEQPQDDRTVNAPPEEAGPQFEVLLESMMGYLYDQGIEKVEQSLQQGQPVERMGMIISTIMVTTHNMLAQQGKTVPPNVMVRAGIELSKAVGEIAMEMGALQQGEDEAIEAAFMMALGQFGKTANDITQAQKQKYAQIIEALSKAKGESRQQGGQQPQAPQQPPQEPMMQGGT